MYFCSHISYQGCQLSCIERVTHTIWPVHTLTPQGPHFTRNFTISHSKHHFSHTNQPQIDSNIFFLFLQLRRMSENNKFSKKLRDFKKKISFRRFFLSFFLYFPSSNEEHGKKIGNSMAKSHARDFAKVGSPALPILNISQFINFQRHLF